MQGIPRRLSMADGRASRLDRATRLSIAAARRRELQTQAPTVAGGSTARQCSQMDSAVMELEIGPGPETGSYITRVLKSVGGGEPSEQFSLDLDELLDRRPLLEASVLSSSVAARRLMSDNEAAIQDVGRRLFDAAFTGSVAAAYRTSMAVASERGMSVQIALRLTAPGLAALPWEALYDSEAQLYLCRQGSARSECTRSRLPCPQDHAPAPRARHDLVASRPPHARRGPRTRAARGGTESADRGWERRPAVARGRVVGRAACEVARARMARTALHRPRHLRHRHRRGRAGLRRSQWSSGLRYGVGPRRPAGRS